ncbi:GumC family protein [Pedobacter alpinus]|uniref:GumC family protein n=1 Tax=Pedobacter alpinus TaxID=1590643 RepID=A0ABW5TTY3_9SPHI
MATQQPQITTLIIPEQKKRALNIKVLITRYVYHWPLFFLTLLIALPPAIVYIKFAKPVYEINASLIIKDNKKAPEQQSALSEIDLVNSAKLIENEIEVLKSNRLITQVVKELELDIAYLKKDDFNTTDLYKSGPVKLKLFNEVLSSDRNPTTFNKEVITVVIKDNKSFFLKSADDQLKEHAFNTYLSNSWGTWKLEPTYLVTDFKGQTIQITITDRDKLALEYQKAIDVSIPNKLSTAISLNLEDKIPQRGKDILNQLIFNYNRLVIEENELKAKATLAFLDNRLDSLIKDLNIAEEGIEGFKSSRGLTDISIESKINLENIQNIDQSLNDVNVKLSIINSIENYVNSSKLAQAPATVGITDPVLNNLIENLSRLQLQREKLLAVSPETNPDFDPIDRQIASTKAALKENVANIKSSLLDTRSKLQSFNNGLASSIKNIPTLERQLQSIERQQSVKAGLYTYLLQKREEIATNYSNIAVSDRVVDQAYASTPKSKKAIVLALALILAFGLPIGIIFLRNVLNDSIINAEQIKDIIDTPIIGDISLEKSQGLIISKKGEANIVSDQLRTLRTNLYTLYGDKKRGRITLVTSSVQGEGKTFISNNLALSLSQIGRKTIILKMVLRQPNLDDSLNISSEVPGVSDFLNNKAKLDEIVQQYELNPFLHIIGSGKEVDNPSELLESEKLKDLIATLQNSYDDIIIDSPSVHLVPDALILSRFTDVTLYIIKQGYTEKTELEFLKELEEKNQLINVHIVFNGIQKAKYGYGYSYKNSYYNKTIKKSIFTDFWKRF